MHGRTTYQPNIALLVCLLWLVVVGQMLWLDWSQTAQTLGDSDDAMRLVEVRAFLAGRGWFDLHEPRLQPPAGYDTHWSRLIDAGLAGLFLIFRTFADTVLAERLMRVVWPVLWLLPAIAGTAALTWRLGGRAATLIALLLLVFALPAFFQFKPGRIDHHDIQITLAILTLAAAIWSDRVPWTAWTAGILSGLALAIGFEAMPFIVLAGGIFVARFASDRNAAVPLARYGLSAAASVATFFFVSVSPNHWAQTACDAIAINSAVPAIVGAFALSIAARRSAAQPLSIRCTAISITIGLAAAAFVFLEPRCLAGPLAMVDPAVRPIWLAHVKEVQSLFAAIRTDPSSGAGIASYPLVAVVAVIVLALDERMRRDSGFIAAGLALILAVAMTIIAIRTTPYTIWLGVPLVAAALLRLFERIKLDSLPARVFATITFSPVVISLASVMTIEALRPAQRMSNAANAKACFAIESYAALAKLPAGLIVTDVDYGPFLLALTQHSVLGAPYHRLSYGIVASHRAFAAPPDEAREILRRAQANYVMTCGSKSPMDQTEAERQRSLWAQLAAGNAPGWLERIPETGPFGVYRFKP
jgi:hypothetical protein